LEINSRQKCPDPAKKTPVGDPSKLNSAKKLNIFQPWNKSKNNKKLFLLPSCIKYIYSVRKTIRYYKQIQQKEKK